MAYGTHGQLWPSGTIPFEIDESHFPTGSANRMEIDLAILEWNRNSVLRLVPRSAEDDFIVFDDPDENSACHSFVGRKGGGSQSVTCDLEGTFNTGNLMHEIGHAAGFYHEHQRTDRNSFVTVGSDSNTRDCAIVQGRLLTDYDCDSIMHYAGDKCGGIAPVASGCGSIGQRQRLSGYDVWGASLLYGVPLHSVVVWEDDSDGDTKFDSFASGFAQNGRRACGPLRLHQFIANQQTTPEVGIAGNRDMVFVWADDLNGNGFFEVKIRGLGANGRQHFSQRTVNVAGAGQQQAPDIGVTHDGRFVVVWEDDTDKNGFFEIKVRGFKRNGTQLFSQRAANVRSRGQQTAPRVAIAPDGFFVVVWEDDSDKDQRRNIRMRGFDPDGTERWSERQVNVRPKGEHKRPQIAMGPFGDFVVVWEDDTDLNNAFQVRMRAFKADGSEKFSERTVNTFASGQQVEPDVAVDDVFRPVVVWADNRVHKWKYQIRMRGFESDGRVRLSERTVNTEGDGQQRKPSIAMEANGRFTVVWENDVNDDGEPDIVIRGFFADGSQLFATRSVSNTSGGHRGRPRVAARAMDLLDLFNPGN